MKIFLLILLGLACYAPAKSQRWRIAPTLGVVGAGVSPSDAYKAAINSTGSNIITDFNPLFRWQFGAFAEYPFSDRLAVRTGLFATGKGYSLKISGPQATIKGNFKSNYLEIPVLLNVAVGQKGYRLVGGPVLGFALNGTLVLDPVTNSLGRTIFAGSTTHLSIGTKSTDGLVPTETSITVGLIRERDRLGLPIEFGIYSQWGLSNWDPVAYTEPTYTIRNTLVSFKIAYFFEVGH